MFEGADGVDQAAVEEGARFGFRCLDVFDGERDAALGEALGVDPGECVAARRQFGFDDFAAGFGEGAVTAAG